MKKITVVLMLLLLLCMSAVHAEIVKRPDTFTGGTTIRSDYVFPQGQLFSEALFDKIMYDGTVKYEFYISDNNVFRDMLFDKADIEMKIDNNPVQSVAVKKVGSFQNYDDLGNRTSLYSTSVEFVFPDPAIDQIKLAKRIAFRIRDVSGNEHVFIVPDSVLVEWQQVINTEK